MTENPKSIFQTKFSLRGRGEERISRWKLRMGVSTAPEFPNNSAIPSWCFHSWFWRTLVKAALQNVTNPSGIFLSEIMQMTCRHALHLPTRQLWLQRGEQLLPPTLTKGNNLTIPIITFIYIPSSVIHISPEHVKYPVFFISFSAQSFGN